MTPAARKQRCGGSENEYELLRSRSVGVVRNYRVAGGVVFPDLGDYLGMVHGTACSSFKFLV